MTTWVALLRAVNVGGQGKVSMKPLAAAIQEAGGGRVRTYLQSGNVVLDHDGPEAEVADLVRRCTVQVAAFDTPVVVRSSAEVAALVGGNPFPEVDDPAKLAVAFLTEPVRAADVPALPEGCVEEVRLGARDLYVSYPEGLGRSKLDQRFWRHLPAATNRNWRTVLALHEMAGA